MKRYYLGELEELVLLTMAAIREPAYAVNILQELEGQTGSTIDFSTVHTTLKRLEEKGFSFPKWAEQRLRVVVEENVSSPSPLMASRPCVRIRKYGQECGP